jgi:hypothetical protein
MIFHIYELLYFILSPFLQKPFIPTDKRPLNPFHVFITFAVELSSLSTGFLTYFEIPPFYSAVGNVSSILVLQTDSFFVNQDGTRFPSFGCPCKSLLNFSL